MTARKPPETWFWSHDIQPNQINSVVMPGMRLVRLSSYGAGKLRRFAALVYKEPGPDRSYAIDLGAAELAARLEAGARPVSVTVDSLDDGPRFSVVLENGPGPLSSLHIDLDEAGVRALLDDHHCIADFAAYVVGGVRKFAAIVEERPGPSWFLAGVSPSELDAKLLSLGASLTRLRALPPIANGPASAKRELAAVAERARGATWAWYSELDGDGVARNLENNEAYPFDLDATRDERGVRFTVVMYRERG